MTEFEYVVLFFAVTQFVETLNYKPEAHGFDSPMMTLKFFIDIVLPATPWAWGRLSL